VCGQTPLSTRIWKLGPALVFERLWQRLGLGEILDGLLAGRQFGFAVARAIFVTVLHRVCVSGSDRQAERWRAGYWLPGTEGLALHHWYRAMAWLGQALPAREQLGAMPFGPRCVKDQVEEALFPNSGVKPACVRQKPRKTKVWLERFCSSRSISMGRGSTAQWFERSGLA
jgi:hypothetical protein